jgi:hypothetical protein
MISVTTMESKPACHPAKIFDASHPKIKRSSLSIQSFLSDRMIWMVAKGARIKKTISGKPI